jgi:hypothetical protein
MFNIFDFEKDFAQTLHCIPMQVRLKLDTCCIKLKLEHWNALSNEQKQQLMLLDCEDLEQIKHYREFLINLVKQVTGKELKDISLEPNPPWRQTQQLPLEISQRLVQENLELSIEKWSKLTTLQRFALSKLTESKNFLPACKEFGLC